MIALRFKKLQISCGFLLLLAALILLDGLGLLAWALAPLLFHELGHYLAIKRYGGEIKSVTITAAGAEMEACGTENCGYGGELFIALAGCIFSFALAIVASLAGRVLGSETAYIIAGISLVSGIFNLLPALPLDGGRALYIIVASLFSVSAAEKLLFITSLLISFSILIIGTVILLRTGANFTLIVAGIYILSHMVIQLGVENNRRVL